MAWSSNRRFTSSSMLPDCCATNCAGLSRRKLSRSAPPPTLISRRNAATKLRAQFWKSSRCHRGFELGIVTKSNLIVRDLELLKEVAKANKFSVHITVTTLDVELARILEPRAPRPDLRLDAVRALSQAGLRVGLSCSPVVPGITDSPKDLESLIRAAAEAGADYVFANPLFLKPCSAAVFLPFRRAKLSSSRRELSPKVSGSGFSSAGLREAALASDRALAREIQNHERPSPCLRHEVAASEFRRTVELVLKSVERTLPSAALVVLVLFFPGFVLASPARFQRASLSSINFKISGQECPLHTCSSLHLL